MDWKTGTILDDLVGRTISAIRVNDTILVIDADGVSHAVDVEADCCSESWWADITGATRIIGQVVTAIEDLDVSAYDVEDGRGRQEYDQAYGVRIRCGEGFADFVFRNSSNGYYGGWMGTCRNDPLPADLIQITGDWKSIPQPA